MCSARKIALQRRATGRRSRQCSHGVLANPQGQGVGPSGELLDQGRLKLRFSSKQGSIKARDLIAERASRPIHDRLAQARATAGGMPQNWA